MKIALIADPLDNQNAGVHIYTESLVEGLKSYTNTHEIILIRQKQDKSLKGFKQIELSNIRIPIGYASFRLFLLIPFILRKEKVDVVIEPTHFGPFNLPKSVKRVTIIHDLTPIKFPHQHRWHSQILQRIFLKRILKKAHLIITNSKNTSRDLEEYYPFTKNKNIPILLGKEELYQPTLNETVLAELGVNASYFLSVGTIEPRKNLVRLLNAYEQFVLENESDMELVIVGGMGWKSDAFMKVLKAHPFRRQIKMLGFVKKEQLPVLYSHACALVYPSLYEGFGFPVLEAMACGTPVICSNNSSIPEVGGDVAHYINPISETALLEMMLKLADLSEAERLDIKEKSLQQAAKFSWEKYTQNFLSAIAELT